MEQTISFDELRWLQVLNTRTQVREIPESIEIRLVARRLVERMGIRPELTARGKIALAKLS